MGIVGSDLRTKCGEVDSRAFVSERLKRLSSIVAKLRRKDLPGLSLWTMQDLGGCRAILPTVAGVRAVEAKFENGPFHPIRRKDYIATPRESGYRGVHLIFNDLFPVLKDVQIEVQIRSRLQHIFATAVETVGYFTEQSLKSSMGEKNGCASSALWEQFLRLKRGALSFQIRRQMDVS
jgi:ppGpp synthetase/RelA/SpoT-type nucleotidyltranferase